jgi:hypothetical protein
MPLRRSATFASIVLRRLATMAFASSALAVLAPAASAQVVCDGPVVGKGRSSAVTGSADATQYRGNVPAGLARTRAIANWQARVAQKCPGRSTSWLRAKAKSIDCDGSAGSTNCVARARPARKLF